MTSGQKIIGIRGGRNAEPEIEHVEFDEMNDGTSLMQSEEDILSGGSETRHVLDESGTDEDWEPYYDEEAVPLSKSHYIAPALLAIAVATWTLLFLWANREIFSALPTMKGGIELLTQYCLPVATVAVLYLLYMRNSSREATRFNDVASSLRIQSEQLEYRLKTVNNELAMAREFLASETKQLEMLGDQSSGKLNEAASNIKIAISDGLTNMKKLDEVGGTAYKNLDQLRVHLPFVINTAKDVTNQIGNTGRSAQAEMAGLVNTLKRVGEVGRSGNWINPDSRRFEERFYRSHRRPAQ